MPAGALWTGIVCPQGALQAALRLLPAMAPATPLALHDTVSGRARVIEINRAARGLGVHPGQALADALAIAPDLESLPRDRKAEARLLEELALVAYRYSHQVAITGDGVVLETGGSRRLHGDLDAMLDTLADEISAMGLYATLGTAPAPAAACLLAHTGQHVSEMKTLRETLSGWPIHRLALAPAELQKLDGLGLKSVRDVLALPRFERERRLGRALSRYLDQIHGREQTPLVYWQPPEAFCHLLELPVPTIRSEALLFALNRVLEHLHQWLRVRDRALSAIEIELLPEDRAPKIEFSAGLGQPGFQRDRLLEILRLKLESIRLSSAIESLRVRADSTTEQRPPQADLWTGTNVNDAWPALIDRLVARTGEDGLCSIAPCPDHRPEKAWKWTPPGTTGTDAATQPRPNWLLPEPRPCKAGELRLIDGPERIEAGWWDGQDCRRDYWTAHDRHGNRLWVFREYKPR
ncbi:MAG TPA: DNA polymerase Y family protein, partial [Wenzhouxiangellaceae bacterium]|nr:DNA polymerase Y family protein [Wenzhouxiangellaceae bacterium]